MRKYLTNSLFKSFAPKNHQFFSTTESRRQSAVSARKKVNMLSIDGGGIRGIIPAKRLVFMEKTLQKKLGNPRIKLGEIFDFISGTSTGSILALGLTKPSITNKIKSEYSAEDLLQFYLDPKNRERIFTPKGDFKNFASDLIKVGTFYQQEIKLGTFYKHEPLEALLKEKFGDTKLSEAVISDDIIITSYNISSNQLSLFTKTYSQKHDKPYKMWEIARASSAAPTFFDAATIRNQFYVDGGMVANNPSMAMAGVALSRYRLDQLFCVSLGTGIFNGKVFPKSGGDLTWVRSALSISIDGTAEANNKLARRFFLPGKYHRFQVKLKQDLPLDGIRPEEIQRLLESAELREEEEEKLALVCQELADRYLFNKQLEENKHKNQQHEERMPWLSMS